MKVPRGIEVRHRRSCSCSTGATCDCKPTFRAWVNHPAENRKVRRTFPTLAAAKRWREDAVVDLRRGVLAAPSSPTFGEAADAWLAGAKSGKIRSRSGKTYKPGVVRLYEQTLRDYLLPHLKQRKLKTIERSDVQRLVDRLVEEDLSASTVRNALMPLRAICRRGLIRGEIVVNPTHGLELPALEGRRDRIASPDEARMLLAALPIADQGIWAVAVYGGLRLGEIQALRSGDIDLNAGVIRVQRSWDRKAGPVAPKSAASLRTVPIVATLRPFLAALPADPDALAFGRSAGQAFSPSSVVDRAHRIWAVAGHAVINPHECRHTFASLMIAAGVNIKAVQVFMGHASITVTLDRYGHLLPGAEDVAADLLETYLNASTRGPSAGQVPDALTPLEVS